MKYVVVGKLPSERTLRILKSFNSRGDAILHERRLRDEDRYVGLAITTPVSGG